MADSTLSLLESCCQSSTIQALQALVQNVVGNKTCSLKERSVSALAEEKTFSRVKALFDSSNITLCKEEDAVRAEIRSQQGHAPLILCITIQGLACLATPA